MRLGVNDLLNRPCGGHSIVFETYESIRRPIEQISLPFLDRAGAASLLISVSLELERQERQTYNGVAIETGDIVWARQIDIGAGVSQEAIFSRPV